MGSSVPFGGPRSQRGGMLALRCRWAPAQGGRQEGEALRSAHGRGIRGAPSRLRLRCQLSGATARADAARRPCPLVRGRGGIAPTCTCIRGVFGDGDNVSPPFSSQPMALACASTSDSEKTSGARSRA